MDRQLEEELVDEIRNLRLLIEAYISNYHKGAFKTYLKDREALDGSEKIND